MNDSTKRNAAITATIDKTTDNQLRLTLTFANGKEIRIEETDLSQEITRTALMHGLKQKLVDAAAMSRDPLTGKPATIDDKYAAVSAVYQRLMIGEWNAVREGGGGSGGLLFRALVQMQPGKAPADIRAWLEGKTKGEQDALRKNPKVAAIIDELRAKSGGEQLDTDSLLGELDSI